MDPDLDDAIPALVVAQSAAKLGSSTVADDGFRARAVGLLDLIAGLEPAAATNWCVVRRALGALVSTEGVGEGHRDAAKLLELVELADLLMYADRQAAPHPLLVTSSAGSLRRA